MASIVDVRDCYPKLYEWDYTPLLKSFGYQMLLHVDEDCSCQGDSWVLYQEGDRYGILQFGWGSCAACDALQACDTYEELAELQQELVNSIRWGSRSETCDYLRTHDWGGDWSANSAECKEFVRVALATLELESTTCSGVER